MLHHGTRVTFAEDGEGVVFRRTATDPDGDPVSYSLDGADAALFTVDEDTGEVSFLTPPDFENPADADADNIYDLTVTASDGELSNSLDVTITITDAPDDRAPVFAPGPYADFAPDPFAGIGADNVSAPAFTDLDGDGDLDLVAGAEDGTLTAYERTATGFTEFATNPVDGIDAGYRSTPAFADLDGDGDLDLVVGERDGTLRAYEQTDSGFAAFAANPLADIDVGSLSAPTFADLNNDSDLDLVSGEFDGLLTAFEDQTPPSNFTFAENGTGVAFQREVADPDGDPITLLAGRRGLRPVHHRRNHGRGQLPRAPRLREPRRRGCRQHLRPHRHRVGQRPFRQPRRDRHRHRRGGRGCGGRRRPGPPHLHLVGGGERRPRRLEHPAHQDGGPAVRLQREDGSDGLTGPVMRYRDEGVTFVASPGVTFDVRDLVSGAQRGDEFEVVVLGTMAGDTLAALEPARPYYFNGGMGDNTVTGGLADDFLVGGVGDDRLEGREGDDQFIGGRDRFFLSLAGETGQDTIIEFGKTDLFVSDARLRDGNNDSIITFGPNNLLDLGSDDDTVAFTAINPMSGLRFLGALPDGTFAYADRTTRPAGAREGLLGNSTLNGGPGEQIFFFDTALGLDFGDDRINNFGTEDLLVSTTALADSDGRIGFGSDRILDLPDGTSVVINNQAVRELEFDGAVTRDGVTYYVYTRVGSASTDVDDLFG